MGAPTGTIGGALGGGSGMVPLAQQENHHAPQMARKSNAEKKEIVAAVCKEMSKIGMVTDAVPASWDEQIRKFLPG